jgi:nucleoside 2-deoxyribosyltransferase
VILGIAPFIFAKVEKLYYNIKNVKRRIIMKFYLASQIFSEGWRDYNDRVVNAIKAAYPDIDIYVPQHNKAINDKTKCATAEQITYGDFTQNLDHDDVVIAIVDGDTPGIGTTLEIGYFSRICQEEIERQGYTDKKIISLYTDSRECSHTFLDAKMKCLKNLRNVNIHI